MNAFRWWLFIRLSEIGWWVCPEPHRTNLVPRHSDYDWLILSQSRMGKSFGATRIWMLLATPG
jgi:hypothetical protein